MKECDLSLADLGEPEATSVRGFCKLVGISPTAFYSLPEDERPRIMEIGPQSVRVSKQARLDWLRERERATALRRLVVA